MKIHDAAKLFPLMKGKEYQELVESIIRLGLLKPIELYEGCILDGRNRYQACLEAEVEPHYITLSDELDPFAYVWAVNAERRHLDPGQKATILVLQKKKSEEWRQVQEARRLAANLKRSEAAKGQHKVSKPWAGEKLDGLVSHDTAPSERERDRIAHEAQVSGATAARAQALANKRPDLAEKVAAGEMSLTNAGRIAKKESLEQHLPSPVGKYRVIYADPPWKYSDKLVDGYGPADNHFPSMSIPELCALSIPAEENAVLFLWTTSPMLEDAFRVINAWGFKYKASFVWDKVKHNYGHYNSVRHEFLLVATKGSCVPDNPKLFDSVVSLERTAHSVKPSVFYEIIETLYDQGSRIELFLRGQARDGWDGWGNEAHE